jgi:MSHA biogenesis protein MshN
MSLINKMLQDLDARGTAPGEALPSQVKPVARAPRRLNRRAIAAAVAGACAGVALACFAWSQYRSANQDNVPVPAAPAVAAVAKPAPAPAQPASGMTSTITMLPTETAPAASAAEAAPRPAAEPAAAQPVVERAPAVTAPDAPASASVPAKPPRAAEARTEAAPAAGAAAAKAVPLLAAKSVAPVEPDSDEARAVRRALMQELEARQAGKPALKGRPALPEGRAAQGREQSVAQRAEGEYRRALASMQEGRMIETIAALEQALRIDPRHEAARQTLVGLLIEGGHPDEAMRQLQLGLTQDPRQPALAMLLARLQIERGGSGIETLMRTLPYAGASPDYHAFLAGALQRQQRHREAAAEYLAALRAAPANGVWWMGLGMSLQAEKRNAEALEAFQKAQASGVLSQELQAFVERQIRQLGR